MKHRLTGLVVLTGVLVVLVSLGAIFAYHRDQDSLDHIRDAGW